MARLAKRSFAAVAAFMLSAFATQLALCPTASWAQYSTFMRSEMGEEKDPVLGGLLVTLPLCLATLIAPFLARKKEKTDKKPNNGMAKVIPAAASGAMFAAGLSIGQMVVQSKLFGFLDFCGIPSGRWDPTLATVLGAAVPISMLSYQFVQGWGFDKSKGLSSPVCASKFSVPTHTVIDKNLVLGSVIFGVGWAAGCLCPGPALFVAAVGNKGVIFHWMPAFFAGSHLAVKYKESNSSKSK
jgi:uncharacterized membrane protein YedE/YeeE